MSEEIIDNNKKPIKESNSGKKPIKSKAYKKQELFFDKIKNQKNFNFFLIPIIFFIAILFVNIINKPSIEKIKNSVVKIEVYDANNELIATGSGFCAYKNNYIVTNYHVVEGGKFLKIVTDDNEKKNVKKILIFDMKNDLALLETDANLKPLKFGNIKNIKSGEKVTAIGSPLGELNTVSTGIISNAKNDKGIQISASISHGSSGGALFDKNNKLIGITYATIEAGQNLNYAISLNYLEDIYKAYINNDYQNIAFINCFVDRTYCLDKEGSNILSYADCSSNDKKYYSFENLENLYSCTNPQVRYDNSMDSSKWSNVYSDLSEYDKIKAMETYKQIHEQYYCRENCNIAEEIEDWNISQFMVNLGILKEYELSFVNIDMENYNDDNERFNRIEEYPLDAYQKALILNLVVNKSWNDIHRDNKKDIFDYFNGKGYSTDDLGAILEILGYEVKYHDGILTAYWR